MKAPTPRDITTSSNIVTDCFVPLQSKHNQNAIITGFSSFLGLTLGAKNGWFRVKLVVFLESRFNWPIPQPVWEKILLWREVTIREGVNKNATSLLLKFNTKFCNLRLTNPMFLTNNHLLNPNLKNPKSLIFF